MTSTPHFRAPLRSRRDDVEAFAGVERGLRLGLCGTGGRLDPPPATLDEAVVATEATYGERRAHALVRFAAVPVGAVVWTRDEARNIHRGVLEGPWRYDGTPPAHEVDLVHVRRCFWTAVRHEQVPAAVLMAFDRGGRNFQRITALDGDC